MSTNFALPAIKDELINRMKRIEGQARGIQRMLDEGARCEDVVIQISAMREALSRVGVILSTCQLGTLITEEIEAGGSGKKSLDEMMETFLRLR